MSPVSKILHLPAYLAGVVVGFAQTLHPRRDEKRRAARERFGALWRRAQGLAAGDAGGDAAGAPVEDRVGALRRSVVGLSKPRVAEMLGTPASAFHTEPFDGATPGSYWHADVWYYPADLRRRLAVAIHFEGDRAAGVEPIEGPQV